MSDQTAELTSRLGRHLTADENPLRIYRAQHGSQTLGSVLVMRVKGEHGGIELVTGVETNGVVRRVLVQSQREPDETAAIITNVAFLASFAGKDSAASFRVGEDLPAVSARARASAQAIADGVRSQLIVHSAAETKAVETRR